ncbi:MAG: BrnA antitoxin family protein [Acidobacteriota bacterium]
MSKQTKTDKEIVFEMTQKEYDKGLAKGWTEDDMLPVGTHRFSRSRWAEKLKKSNKVKVSIYLDSEVLGYFKERAGRPDAAPYQTQINNELRKVMENGSPDSTNVVQDILNDKKFLKALKKKLETI